MTPEERLAKHLEEVLTGPTSGSNARRLAQAVVSDNPREVALKLIAAAQRYLDEKVQS